MESKINDDVVLIGLVAIRDDVRPEAKEAICEVREAGIQVVLLTKQLEQLSAEAKSIESMLQATDPLCRHIHVRELTPELLKEFVQSITVYPGGVINIMWNYRDSYSIPNMTCE